MRKFTLLLTCLLLSVGLAVAQTKQVRGLVVDESGEPVIGASVIVKGTSSGATTGVDGTFSFSAPESARTLQIKFLGMIEQEVTISDNIRVVLKEDARLLDEVVVTAMGIKRSEKSLGYAATAVSSDELTEARSADVVSALSGKIAGVQIGSTSSDPGASNSIIIRGVSSLSGNNQPLFVIDGVPMNNSSVKSSDALDNGYDYGNSANLVNPDDVESMTILKGASATALYGSRAASGVVVITTKSGKKGSGFNIEYNGGFQISDVLRLPQFQNEFGMGWDATHTLIENGSWGPRMDGSMQLWGNVYNNSQKMKPFSPMKNNVRDFFENGIRYSNGLSFSGGSDATDYFVSFSQLSDDGAIPTSADTYDKYTFSLRGSHEVKNLKVSTSVNYSTQENNFAPTGQGLTIINSLYQTPRDISIVGLKDLSDPFNTVDYYYTPYGVTNPYYLISTVENNFKQSKFFGKLQLDYKFLNDYLITYRFGYDATDNQMKLGSPRITATPGTPNAGLVNQQGSVEEEMSKRIEFNHDFLINYMKKAWDDQLDISVIAGTNLNERTYSSLNAEVTGLDIPTYYNLSNSAASPVVEEYYAIRRMVGLFGEAQLGYKNFLYLTLTARNDWSSTLPKNNNSFFYPGTALSFVFTELLPDHMKKSFSFGKIRLAYGKTGNDADVYMIDPYYTKSIAYNEFGDISFPLGGVNAFSVGNTLGNMNLSPEMTSEYEVGLNLAFFNGRIGLDAAYYDRTSDKQIFSLNMDPASGYTKQNINLGEISNKGVELLVNLIPVRTRDFEWRLSWNYTKNNSKVVSLPEELGGEAQLYGFGTTEASTYLYAKVGYPIGVFKVTSVEKSPDGQIVVSPTTGLPQAAGEAQVAGDVNFDYEMGIGNMFKYKFLSFGFDIDIRQGGVMYSRTKDINYFTGNAAQTTYNDRNPFIVPNSVVKLSDGTYQENTIPIATSYMDDYFSAGADRLNAEFLVPRSYIKLRSVTLGFDFPKSWLKGSFLEAVKLSAYGTNLLLWTPEENSFIDPEVSTFGNDLVGKFGEYSANPTTRKYGLNVQVKF